jgi:hypothetical protein
MAVQVFARRLPVHGFFTVVVVELETALGICPEV